MGSGPPPRRPGGRFPRSEPGRPNLCADRSPPAIHAARCGWRPRAGRRPARRCRSGPSAWCSCRPPVFGGQAGDERLDGVTRNESAATDGYRPKPSGGQLGIERLRLKPRTRQACFDGKEAGVSLRLRPPRLREIDIRTSRSCCRLQRRRSIRLAGTDAVGLRSLGGRFLKARQGSPEMIFADQPFGICAWQAGADGPSDVFGKLGVGFAQCCQPLESGYRHGASTTDRPRRSAPDRKSGETCCDRLHLEDSLRGRARGHVAAKSLRHP